MTIRPGTAQIYVAEHGPTRDDEVDLIRPGANYGWDPSQGGTAGWYDESAPMTDRERFPEAVEAVRRQDSGGVRGGNGEDDKLLRVTPS